MFDVPTPWAGSQTTWFIPNAFLYVSTGVVGQANKGKGYKGEDEDGRTRIATTVSVGWPTALGMATSTSVSRPCGGPTPALVTPTRGARSPTSGATASSRLAGGPAAATPNEQIAFENQADCFSGSFLDYSARYTPLGTPSTARRHILHVRGSLGLIGDDAPIGQAEQGHGSSRPTHPGVLRRLQLARQ